ncbi:hypothetical protein SAMN02745824_2183 [Parasphingorhabdus marina DSM 22363]|uniref:Uncharacterized protein n=1 Tax=Parasphingorhabdus marina DSM 22363 TaxID=1123272 RepID=A0A1N6F139_9SPHN|nr:hypothetical protein [Parasphingorhabdus marina]SIN88990.1 hypothetical protein SAMN02745824_2183 [Parasphingorhabdus marina DSM 22363]
MRNFENFACVDWSGARIERPPGIAVATIGSDGPPALLNPSPRWSREDVKNWLLRLADNKVNILVGFDLSTALPFRDCGCYFPEWTESPKDARSLWRLVDGLSRNDPWMSVGNFLQHPEAQRHFRHGRDNVGDLFTGGIGRLRRVEQHQRDTGQANSASCFNLVGAAQVGKSSLTGMRLLHQLEGTIPVWPFDPVPDSGPVIVEIYTTIAALAAGLPRGRSKVRDRDGLEKALGKLDVPSPARLDRYDDHRTDAMITAAWMKQASRDPRLWAPPELTSEIAQKEGWTFGVF